MHVYGFKLTRHYKKSFAVSDFHLLSFLNNLTTQNLRFFFSILKNRFYEFDKENDGCFVYTILTVLGWKD